MKNLIKSRRGIAIEMAIGAMFIMIALSIVLISISGMQTRHMKSDLNDFHEKVERYEVMDYLEKNLNTNDDPFNKITNEQKTATIKDIYTIFMTEQTTSNDITTSTYKISKGDEVILTLKIKSETNGDKTTNTITSWGK